MNAQQPVSPRRRMQQLLAIPDRDRTDAEWDELNELEIQLAPGNRDTGSERAGRVPGAPAAPRQQGPRGQGKGGHQRQAGQPRAQANPANPPAAGDAEQAPQPKKQFRKPRPPRPPRSEGGAA